MLDPSGFWTKAALRYTAKFDPFLSLDCAPSPPCPPPWRNPRKGRDQILPSGNLGALTQVATTAAEQDGIEYHRGLNCSGSDSAVSTWLRSVFGINSEKAEDKVRSGSAFARRPVSAAGEVDGP